MSSLSGKRATMANIYIIYIENVLWICQRTLHYYWSNEAANWWTLRFVVLLYWHHNQCTPWLRHKGDHLRHSISWHRSSEQRERDVPKPTPYHHRVRQPFIKLSRNDSHNEKYVRSLISITIIDRVHNGCGLKSSWGTKVKGKHIHLWLDHQLEDIEDVPLLNSFYL